jgi:hypothetical protein
LRGPLALVVDLLAAVPSVVYGRRRKPKVPRATA